jgi:DNA-binding CsgD family transcriptional regulator
MKYRLLLLILFFVTSVYSQNEVYLFKDINNEYSINNIKDVNFQLVEKGISEKHSDATYWFKIPANKTALKYIFRINSIRTKNPKAFQNSKEIQKILNERYIAFKFDRALPVYIRVTSDFIANYPFDLDTETASIYKEKIQLIINNFYYGFAFLVILYSFFYFFYFKDDAFLHYSLLLFSLTFGFFLIDGMFNFFKVDAKIIDFIILVNYIFLAFFSSKFVQSFLQLDNYFPKLKRYTYSLMLIIILSSILFLSFKIHSLFILINILVFLTLFIYWFVGVMLYKNNAYTKIFVFAYVTLLFSGIDYLVLKNLGYPLFDSNASSMKIGGLIQIIVISFAVLFREKSLRDSNYYMKNEIIKYSKEIEQIVFANKDETKKNSLENLSIREKEIFNLIASGNSNKEIANLLIVSVNTVKFHIKNVYEKLEIKSRKEAVAIDKFLKK